MSACACLRAREGEQRGRVVGRSVGRQRPRNLEMLVSSARSRDLFDSREKVEASRGRVLLDRPFDFKRSQIQLGVE